MDFWGDRRGQPVQIGFILLFGILVLAFASYQGYVVPNQNAQVELQHSQAVTSDMQTFRVNLLNAAENGQRYATEFHLGTDYPPRLVALNPPPVTGNVETESLGSGRLRLVADDASLEDICGYSRDGDGAVPSEGLVYRPSYTELADEPSVVYENTVSYRSYDSSGAVQFDSEQTLIDGRTITVAPLVGNVSKQGTQTHTVDVYPGKAGVGETTSTEVTLVVPTALSEDHWRELLDDEMAPDGPVTGVTANGSDVDIELEATEYDVVCPVVGTDGAPGNSPDHLRGSGDAASGGSGDVRLTEVERHPDDRNYVVLTFTNPGDDVNLSTSRFNFYQADNDDGPERLDLYQYDRSSATLGTQVVDDLVLRGDYQSPSTTTTFSGDDDVTSVAVEFEEGTNRYSPATGDIVILNVGFSDGQRANYFVDVPQKSTTVSNDPPTADFQYSPSDPSAGETIDFTSTASDPDGNIVSYEWDWTSDGSYDATGSTAQHSYPSSGTYTVTHRVTDDSGATDTVTKDVTVGSGGGSGDTTPPTVNSLSATARSTDGNSNDAEAVDFTYDASDSSGLGSIQFVVTYKGSQVGSRTLNNPAPSGSPTVQISSSKPSNGNPVNVDVTFTDDSSNSNSRTCTGGITSMQSTISKSGGGITCNP
jgi:PKD repeat protein